MGTCHVDQVPLIKMVLRLAVDAGNLHPYWIVLRKAVLSRCRFVTSVTVCAQSAAHPINPKKAMHARFNAFFVLALAH